MAKRTGPTNVYLQGLIAELKKAAKENDASVWKTAAEKLEKPRRQKIEVNLVDIDRHTEKGNVVLVPGAVLAKGELGKVVTVAAWRFSPEAEKKIKDAKGEALTIQELLKKNPNGREVKIIC